MFGHERLAFELFLEREILLPDELLQNLWESCRVDVRVECPSWLPLLAEKPAVGKNFILRTQLLVLEGKVLVYLRLVWIAKAALRWIPFCLGGSGFLRSWGEFLLDLLKVRLRGELLFLQVLSVL